MLFNAKSSGRLRKNSRCIVGNLKDSVVVTENSDGTKDLKGTISEAQIPSIANALASFETKNSFNRYTV